MSQELPLLREMDGIDELFESLMEKTKQDVDELEEVSQNLTEDGGENSDEINDVTNPGFQDTEAETEGQETDEVESRNKEDKEPKPDHELEEASGERDDKGDTDLEVQREPSLSYVEQESVKDHEEETEEQLLRRLRFGDQATPYIRFNSRGVRHYRRQLGGFKHLEDRFIEFAKVDLPAHKAAWDGNIEALEHMFIWKHKEGVPCVDRNGATPLHLAARRNQVNAVRWLMKYSDLSVMHQASRGETPVHVAAALGHTDCVKTLLASEERDVKYILSYLQDRLGFTCLLLAIHKHQNASAKILIDELGVRSVSAINDTGINSAHVAASAGNIEVLKFLHTKHRKLLHQRAADGTTPVYFAAQEGRLQALQYLYDTANCDMMKASEDGLKPIHAACQTGHTSIVKFIISRLGNAALLDPIIDGATPIHFAAAAGKVKTALWLLKNDPSGELINSVDNHGDSPLHDAVESGHLDLVKILLEQGADLYAPNKFGKTPYSLAMEGGSAEMQEFIQQFVTRKAEEEEALLNPMSIFDMEGGEEVVNMETDGEEPEPSVAEEEYPYESEGPTPIPSKHRLAVIAKKPSLRLWPPMPVGEDSEDEEEEEEEEEEANEEQNVLENIEEEEESDEMAAEEENETPPEINNLEQEAKNEENNKEEKEEEESEEESEKENKNDEREERYKYYNNERQTGERQQPQQVTTPSAVAVVKVVSEGQDELEEEEEEEEEHDDDDQEWKMVDVQNNPVKEEVTAIEVENVEVEKQPVSQEKTTVKTKNEVFDNDHEESNVKITAFAEVKLRKAVSGSKKMNRRSSDPDFKGAGPELKKIFRLRKNRDNKQM